MDQIECLSKFSKLSNFLQIISNWGSSNKDILFIPVYPLSLYIKLLIEKKNPPVCLNGLRHHTPNSIYLYLLLISQLKPLRTFILNHALELLKDYIQFIESSPSPLPASLLWLKMTFSDQTFQIFQRQYINITCYGF